MHPGNVFHQLAGRYAPGTPQAVLCWEEIEKAYTHPKRHYHTLQHLENLLLEMERVKTQISDWDTVLFTLFYHDIVYKAGKNDNEEKSAALAVARLTAWGVPNNRVELCRAQILATKSHAASADHDTNLFTDADLSILGKPWPVYEQYLQQVRKEYAIYPDLLYKPGRRKVLQHFLDMPFIFKTAAFRDRYETQARQNLARELEMC